MGGGVNIIQPFSQDTLVHTRKLSHGPHFNRLYSYNQFSRNYKQVLFNGF